MIDSVSLIIVPIAILATSLLIIGIIYGVIRGVWGWINV